MSDDLTVGAKCYVGDATATLFGVPLEVDASIEHGEFGFVIEMKI